MVRHTPIYITSKFGTKLSILEVRNDSRCPTDAQCKWAGNAEVFLKIKLPNSTDTTFVLNTYQNYESDKEIHGYSYRLIELTPYPKVGGVGILQANYKARIRIEKRK